MNKALLTFCVSITGLCAAGQNAQYNGVILFQSSGKKPAVKVAVRDKHNEANTFYSTSTGKFNLIYPNKKPGDKVELLIDPYDGTNTAIEVVNDRELKNYISSDANEVHEIIVCRKGDRDAAAQKYYEIIKTSADKELLKVKGQLDYFISQAEKNYDTLQNLFKKLDELKKQNDSLVIYREAFAIASINKDRANDRVLKYIQLLDEGKSIQEAREALSLKKAAQELRESVTLYGSAVEELEIRAKASRAIYDYRDAINCLDTIILFSERIGIAREKLAGWYLKISDVLLDNGEYVHSLDFINKALPIYEKESIDSMVAGTYSYFHYAYTGLGDYRKALECDTKALVIVEKEFEKNHAEVGRAFGNLALSFNNLGEYEKALHYILKTIPIFSDTSKKFERDLAGSYNILGVIYFNLQEYPNALEYINKSIPLIREIEGPESLELGRRYGSLGAIYNAMNKNEQAVEYQKIGLAILEKRLGNSHPELAGNYNNLAGTYKDLKEFKKSEEYSIKSLNIYIKTFDTKYPRLAEPYINLAETYQALGNYTGALEFSSKAVAVLERRYDKPNFVLARAYKDKSTALTYLHQLPEALISLNQCIDLQTKILPRHKEDYQDAIDCRSALYFQTGKELYLQNEFTKAIENLKLVEYSILLPYAKDYLGLCYISLKDYPSALVYFKELLRLDTAHKVNVHIYNNLGFAYARNGQLEEAKKAFEIYERQQIDLPLAYKNWAMYYALKKDKEKTIENLQKAIEKGYKNWNKISTDEYFEFIRTDERYIRLLESIKEK